MDRFSRLPDIRIDDASKAPFDRRFRERRTKEGFLRPCPTQTSGDPLGKARSGPFLDPGSRVPGPGAMAGESLQGELDWGFSQVFGERSPGEEVQDGASRT